MADLSREQWHWERLAGDDPMWVILTEPAKRGRWTDAEFFESGRIEIANRLALLASLGLQPNFATAVDFGCGIGRLTQALAERFAHVHGVDISERMIAAARARNRHGDRVTYHVNATDRLGMLQSGTVDFIYSHLVLQHIPRRAAERYIAEFGRVLAPGGIALFQTLTRARSAFVRVRHAIRNIAPDSYRWLRDHVSGRPRWEMNVLSERAVRKALGSRPTVMRHVLDDDSGGDTFESRLFVAVRPSASPP